MSQVDGLVGSIVVAASLAVGAAIAFATVSGRHWPLIFINGALTLLPVVVATLRRRFDIFEPVYLFATVFCFFFVIRPTLDMWHEERPYWFGYSLRGTYDDALLIASVGAIAFYVGYYSRVGARLSQSLPLPRSEWRLKSLDSFAAITIVAAVPLFAAFLASSGGITAVHAVFSGRTEARDATIGSASGYLYSSPLLLLSVGILILAVSVTWWSGRALLGFGLILCSQVLAIGGGDRSWLLPAAAAVGLTSYLRRRRRPTPLAVGVLAILVLFVGLTIPREFRSADERGTNSYLESATDWRAALGEFFGGADAAMAPNLAVELLFVPTEVPHQFGRTYLGALALPIPRELYPDKPAPGEAKVMDAAFRELSSMGVGLSFSFFGEPYLNFGLSGVVVAALAFGILARLLYAWFARAPCNPTVIALFALNWPFVFVYMRGGFGVDYYRQVLVLSPLIVLLIFARRREHHTLQPRTV